MAKDIKVALELDNKQFNSALKQSKAQVDKFGKESSTIIAGLGKAFVALGLGSLIVDIGRTAARFQDLQNSLNVVFGSVREGAAQFERIQTFAASTQFSVEDLTQAFVQLKGVGIDPTEEMLMTFADTASTTIDQLGAFESMVKLVTKSVSGGLGIEELDQLMNRSIPVYDILEEKLGIVRDEVSEFGKSAEGARQIVDTLTEGLRERFGGALAASAGNLSRATNNLGDAFDKLKVALFGAFGGDTAGLINKLTEAIEKLADNTEGIKQFGKVLLGLGIAIASVKGLGVIRQTLDALSKSFITSSKNAAKTGGVFKSFGTAFKSFFAGVFGSTGQIVKGVGKSAASLGTFGKALLRTKQIIFSFSAVFAALPKLLLRLAGPAGAIYAVVQAIDLLAQAAFNGFSPLQKFKDVLYDIWKFLTPWWNDARAAAEATEELEKATTSAAVAAQEARTELKRFVEALGISDSLEKAQGYLEDFKSGAFNTELENAENAVENTKKVIADLQTGIQELSNSGLKGAKVEVSKLTELLNASNEALKFQELAVLRLLNLNFDDFYAQTKNEITLAENAQARLNDTLARLKSELDKGLITQQQYNIAMKILGQTVIDVADRVKSANDTFVEFGNTIKRQTDDLQKTLDQLNMTAFEKQQDDIRRNLELLRDETIAKLKKDMEGLDPSSEAYKNIQQQIQDVTNATDEAILKQQELGQKGYDASREFDTGWQQALNDFVERSTDSAAQAKAIFQTFTKGIEDAFVNFVKTGKLSFKDLISSMIEMLVRSKIQQLLGTLLGMGGGGGGIGGFFKSIFGLANGGPAQGGRPYIVGEEGPELFVPKTSGTVVPNDKMGSGQVINNNTYVTNQISAVDAKSVAQLFVENRQMLLGSVQMAQKELP